MLSVGFPHRRKIREGGGKTLLSPQRCFDSFPNMLLSISERSARI